MNILDGIINFFKIKNILGKNWIKNDNVWISILTIKDHISDQINLMDNRDEKK